jgi:hypothetical protein
MLAVAEENDGDLELLAVLPVPTRVGTDLELPSEILGRLCLRFGDLFQFARETASLLVRISADLTSEMLGKLPDEPFVHEGRILAPINLAEFLPPDRWECRIFCVIRVSDLQEAMNDPDPWRVGAIEHIQLINGIFTLLSDNVNCIGNWGFYLFDPAFEAERELRNKVGAIWLTSMLDSLEAEVRSAETYQKQADEHGLHHLSNVLEQVRTFFRYIREILALYSREEQLFIRDFRDQIVHSWLARRHVDAFRVKYFSAGEFRQERISSEDFNALLRPFYASGPLDRTLATLLGRGLDQGLPYWKAVHELRAKLPMLQDAMILGRMFVLSSLVADQTKP